jgi:hypothetical protein
LAPDCAEQSRLLTPVYTEYNSNYARSFSLSSRIDQNKIGAELKDGVLSVTLPKVSGSQTAHHSGEVTSRLALFPQTCPRLDRRQERTLASSPHATASPSMMHEQERRRPRASTISVKHISRKAWASIFKIWTSTGIGRLRACSS